MQIRLWRPWMTDTSRSVQSIVGNVPIAHLMCRRSSSDVIRDQPGLDVIIMSQS